MRRLLFIIVLAVSACAVWAEQATISKDNAGVSKVQTGQPTSDTDQQAQPAGTDDSQPQDQADKAKKPGALKRLKRHVRNQVSSGCVQPIGTCWDKPPQDEAVQEPPQQTADVQKGRPPRSTSSSGESSSRNTKIDLSPPPGEAAAPGVGTTSDSGDVQEMKPWDPHKAEKNVEIGDFYFKRGNYRAAESRYKEALYWKDNEAIAMFRLAQAQEKLGEFADAHKNYSAYLSVLPRGEFAAEAKASLERLKDKISQTVPAAAPQ